MIVGGISLEATPPTRQDYAETTSIIVNGRKGLYEHGHRGAFPVAVISARPAIGRAACPLVGHPKAAPQHGASNSYSAARSSPAITASAMARSDAGRSFALATAHQRSVRTGCWCCCCCCVPSGRHRVLQRWEALKCFIRWIAAGFIRQAAHLIYGSKTRCLGGRFGGCRTGLKLTISARM